MSLFLLCFLLLQSRPGLEIGADAARLAILHGHRFPGHWIYHDRCRAFMARICFCFCCHLYIFFVWDPPDSGCRRRKRKVRLSVCALAFVSSCYNPCSKHRKPSTFLGPIQDSVCNRKTFLLSSNPYITCRSDNSKIKSKDKRDSPPYENRVSSSLRCFYEQGA